MPPLRHSSTHGTDLQSPERALDRASKEPFPHSQSRVILTPAMTSPRGMQRTTNSNTQNPPDAAVAAVTSTRATAVHEAPALYRSHRRLVTHHKCPLRRIFQNHKSEILTHNPIPQMLTKPPRLFLLTNYHKSSQVTTQVLPGRGATVRE
ncbi:hypothetical protein KC19_8G188300 [Ceratodon purpureus]|uniref:Uncharacterized protein n=1 Tax=Ceratodon purpureus TaxID=3225 RepID=A0A8T0H8L5_CERPU|nr:hypothetical protein KC19_8G188300 [Ceratodon purpureus]